MLSPVPVGSPQYVSGASISQSLTLSGGDLLMAVIHTARDVDPGVPSWNGKALTLVQQNIHPSVGHDAVSVYVLKDYDQGTFTFASGSPTQYVSLTTWANVASFYGAGNGEESSATYVESTQALLPGETAVLCSWCDSYSGVTFNAGTAFSQYSKTYGAYVIATGASAYLKMSYGSVQNWNSVWFVLRPILQNKGCVMWI